MKNLIVLTQKAKEYAEAYARTYHITDTEYLDSIYVTHLAWLLNRQEG